jgi:hypothetical protein
MLTFPTLITGTITGLRISAVDGTAFIDNAGATILTYADGNHRIEIYDSSNRMLKGVLKAAGTSATEGSDSARTFVAETGTPTIAGDQITFSNAIEGVMESDYWINGGLYLVDWSIASYAGSGNFYLYGGGIVTTGISKSANGNYASYITSNSVNLRVASALGCSGIATINSIKQVLTPSASGVTIVSTKGGATQSFASKDASFTYNAASYRYAIYDTLKVVM